MNKSRALDQLCRLLQGRSTPDADWAAVLELANRALVTPRLEGSLDAVDAPVEVRTFVQDVARRNAERNARLFAQMGEAAVALNAVGIVPMALKGGACLARDAGRCSRVLNDIDLVVAPDEIEVALQALRDAGFSLLSRRSGVALHAVAELGRPQDVGPIDLHQRPPGPPGFVSGDEILRAGKVWPVGAGQVRAPEPHMHVYLQALHDQLHDGAYWRGGFDLRHAWDIADLIQGGDGVDWDRLYALPPTRLTTHVVEAQVMACHRLTGAPIPAASRGVSARVQYGRQRLQYVAPLLRAPLAILAMLLETPNLARHRAEDRRSRAAAGLPPRENGLSKNGLARLGLALQAATDERL